MSIASYDQNQNATVINYKRTLAMPNGYEVFNPIRDAALSWVAMINAAADDIKDDRLPAYLLQNTATPMFAAGRFAHSAALVHKREFQEADKRVRQPVETIDFRHAPERRQRYRNMKVGSAMAAIANADLADAAALVVDGNLANLAPDAFALANERYLVLNVLERTGMAAQYAAKPTVSDPLATGVDEAAAQRAADVVIDAHKARGKMVATHGRILQDYAAFLAEAFDLSAGDVFDRMLAA